MKTGFVSIAFLFLALFTTAHAEDETIKLSIEAFLGAIKQGDGDLAVKSVYQPPGAEQRSRDRVRNLAQKAIDKGTVPEYVDAKAKATLALAILKDTKNSSGNKPDFDAVLLLKRENKWSVVLSIIEIEDRADVLTSDERIQLSKLREWQDLRMRELAAQK